MDSFWKDKEKKQIDPELFSSRAEDLARKVFAEASSTVNNHTQLRKFYDEVVRFGSIAKTDPGDFERTLPYLKMLNAKAAYAMGRKLISKSFKDFISESLGQVTDRYDFEAFAGLFESFMGYYKYYDKGGEGANRGGGR
ncbi:MAG: type III-A CRISPR-associated protein Csm2 [Syntrophorhabdaceae bacterium]|nr:type III-A CRISPR-associated protein Csm2 [Syntrophorhabdaceae bacterium]MDD4197229.1 type III-A CRISPR-associated protein Csm2 [Syntrophorhabdaceae bacterium]